MTPTLTIDKEEVITLLISGRKGYRCGTYLYNLDPLHRQQIYHELETERLETKYRRIKELFEDGKLSWPNILFVSLMSAISDGNRGNKECYKELAMRIDFNTILRERKTLQNLEALLIAVSGLGHTLPKDSYSRALNESGDYLLHKYDINPIPARNWNRKNMAPCNEPVIRLSQIARILFDNENVFSKLIEIKRRDDIFNLLNVEASEDICRLFGGVVRHIGAQKCDLLGINFVVPMLYAYGHNISSDDITDAANNLNEELPAESNRYITKWRNKGLTPICAYESQALIQLAKEYCEEARCESCPIAKHICSKASIIDKIPNFWDSER